SFALYSVGLFALFILNFNAFGSPIIFPLSALTPLQVVFASMPIVLICAAAVFVVYDFLMQFTATIKGGLAFVPVVFSVYTLVTLTQILLMHYGFSFSSMWLSFIYVAAAFACIVFGFSKRYIFMRRFGLGLALLSVTKLFIIDLYWLTTGWRILSYFVLGAVLLSISFVYQFFNKRLELNIASIKSEEL
ncbi:MAG: DUF2339 domain-containing protein, partial [Defluviitaleaceae bacterium]|nr:DUF2339 domain-containing protein [Defluviitaleaceae bacterium]